MKNLPLDSFPFQPKSRFSPAFGYTLESVRKLEVFRWDDRLVAHEQERGFWWCTFDVCGSRDAHEFWLECVAHGRIGRLFSVERSFLRSSPAGATMVLGPYSLYMVVAQDNSSIARRHEDTVWHPVAAGKVQGIRKPLATLPTIWGKGFHGRFALRALDALGEVIEADALANVPASIREVWVRGASAPPVRLVAAAMFLRWVDPLRGRFSTSHFWKSVLLARPHFSAASKGLLAGVLRSPEANLPGDFIMPWYSHSQGEVPPVFHWQQSKVAIRLEFGGEGKSAHQQLEYRLELRDWLTRFGAQKEVESLFSS